MLLCLWDSPGRNTGMGCHFLLQGVFPSQGSNTHFLCLRHCRQIRYHWAAREAHSLYIHPPTQYAHKNIFILLKFPSHPLSPRPSFPYGYLLSSHWTHFQSPRSSFPLFSAFPISCQHNPQVTSVSHMTVSYTFLPRLKSGLPWGPASPKNFSLSCCFTLELELPDHCQ